MRSPKRRTNSKRLLPHTSASRSSIRTEARITNAALANRKWLVLWWYKTEPRLALYDNFPDAMQFAKVANATVVELLGDAKIGVAIDYWRRDENDNPMPFRHIKTVSDA